jgi:hypothetical protein
MNQTANEQNVFAILEAKGLLKAQFEPFFMARGEWAIALQCSRTSFWVYEQKIIRLVFPVLKEYQKSDFLDNYQRFVLAVIYAKSQGWLDGKRWGYADIKKWLMRSHTQLTREQFNNWINNA